LAGGLNFYSYPTNPVQWADPRGLLKDATECRYTPPSLGSKQGPELSDALPKGGGAVTAAADGALAGAYAGADKLINDAIQDCMWYMTLGEHKPLRNPEKMTCAEKNMQNIKWDEVKDFREGLEQVGKGCK
jgi:uncharacterized protein RhaS with RHS repeats